jgi:hypothetical protein
MYNSSYFADSSPSVNDADSRLEPQGQSGSDELIFRMSMQLDKKEKKIRALEDLSSRMFQYLNTLEMTGKGENTIKAPEFIDETEVDENLEIIAEEALNYKRKIDVPSRLRALQASTLKETREMETAQLSARNEINALMTKYCSHQS